MPSRPLIAAVGGDPGPARALAPVLRKLAQGPAGVLALTYGQAGDIWSGLDLARKPLAPGVQAKDCAALLRDMGAAALLVGTSYNELMLEHLFLEAARVLGLPSLAVLDFPSHFRARFSGRDGRLSHLPDAIAVDSAATRRQMLAQGFPEQVIQVTGAPAFDSLAGFREAFREDQRQQIRQALGAGPGEFLVLFASQPLSRFYEIRPGSLGELAFNERQVLEAVGKALARIARRSGRSLVLVVRPHPREDPADFDWFSSPGLKHMVSNRFTSWEVVCAADLVVGMNSVLLMEACHLGRIVVSVQPGQSRSDSLPTNLSGHSHAVYELAQAEPTLERLLLDPGARQEAVARLADLKSDGQAAARVAELLLHMAGLQA